jgi:N-ethylmaleimide reductase
VRISPLGKFNDMGDADPQETFGYVADRLNELGLAYLHVVRPGIRDDDAWDDPEARAMMEVVRDRYQGTLIVAGGFSREEAEEWLQAGKADLVAFGRKFLANPDLPGRFRTGAVLNHDDPTTYYGGGARGYTDYPTLEQERGEHPMPCVDETWR